MKMLRDSSNSIDFFFTLLLSMLLTSRCPPLLYSELLLSFCLYFGALFYKKIKETKKNIPRKSFKDVGN